VGEALIGEADPAGRVKDCYVIKFRPEKKLFARSERVTSSTLAGCLNRACEIVSTIPGRVWIEDGKGRPVAEVEDVIRWGIGHRLLALPG
jgi:hypothetical protein